MASPPPPDRICVAQIGAAHGIRGEVRLHAFTADPTAVARYGALEAEDGRRSFAIEAMRQAKDCLIVRLAGVTDRTTAEGLRNQKLFVRRDRLPEPDDAETYYHADLIGLLVVDREGRELGIVAAIHDFGAGDLVEVKPAGGGPTVMLPFTRTVVPVVEMKSRRLVVEAPDGAFDAAIAPAKPAGRGRARRHRVSQ